MGYNTQNQNNLKINLIYLYAREDTILNPEYETKLFLLDSFEESKLL